MKIQLPQSINYFVIKDNNKTDNRRNIVSSNKLHLSKDTVSFKALKQAILPDTCGFEYTDILKVKEFINNTSYGVDLEALLKDDKFTVKVNKDNVVLYNFVTPESFTNKLIGRCDELTYKLGKKLEDFFGYKYEFYAISENNHYYIAASTREYSDNHNLLLLNSPAKYINAPLSKLPDNFFFIDPSLKKYGTNENKGFNSFTLWNLVPLESINPYKGYHSIEVRYYPFFSSLVVGSVQRLFDQEFSDKFSKKYPVSLDFFKDYIGKDHFKVDLKVKITGEYGAPIYCNDEDLKIHSPTLYKVVEKIRSSLQEYKG